MKKKNVDELIESNLENLPDDDHKIENEVSEEDLKDTRSKSWFLMLANPQKIYGEEVAPKDICDMAVSDWCGNDENRSALVAFCISANGFRHLHLCVCSKNAERFSAVKKAFPKANIRATRGTKAEVENYIHKRGKYEEKGEIVVCTSQKGEVIGRQGQRNDLKNISELLDNGYSPEQIFETNMLYRKFEKMIRDEYFARKQKIIPFMREVKVYWHVGKPGSGKSYTSLKLCEKYGRENVYVINSYDSGSFDKYSGQNILFLDEFKGGFTYQQLLSILDRYTLQVHCRYSNTYMLWNEVHITSVFPPEDIFKMLVSQYVDIDNFEQLKRRITQVVYHYVEDGDYKEYRQDISEYTKYDNLIRKAKADKDGFMKIENDNDSPFEQLSMSL